MEADMMMLDVAVHLDGIPATLLRPIELPSLLAKETKTGIEKREERKIFVKIKLKPAKKIKVVIVISFFALKKSQRN